MELNVLPHGVDFYTDSLNNNEVEWATNTFETRNHEQVPALSPVPAVEVPLSTAQLDRFCKFMLPKLPFVDLATLPNPLTPEGLWKIMPLLCEAIANVVKGSSFTRGGMNTVKTQINLQNPADQTRSASMDRTTDSLLAALTLLTWGWPSPADARMMMDLVIWVIRFKRINSWNGELGDGPGQLSPRCQRAVMASYVLSRSIHAAAPTSELALVQWMQWTPEMTGMLRALKANPGPMDAALVRHVQVQISSQHAVQHIRNLHQIDETAVIYLRTLFSAEWCSGQLPTRAQGPDLICHSEAHASHQLRCLYERLRSSAVLVRSPSDNTEVRLLAESVEAIHHVLWNLSLRSWSLQGWKGTGSHSGLYGMSLPQWGQIKGSLNALWNITRLRNPDWVQNSANPLNRMDIFAQLLNHLASGLLQTADQVGVENPAPMFRKLAQAVLKMRDQMICLSQATRYHPAPGQMVPQAGGPAAPGLMGWGVPAPVIDHQGFRYVENDGEPGASKKRKDRAEEETEAQKEAKRRKAIREGKAPEKRPCVGSGVCGARALVPDPLGLLSDADDT